LAICLSGLLRFKSPEVLLSKVGETGNNVLADQVFWLGQVTFRGDLDLQTALSEIEIEHFFYARGGCGWCDALMLCYLVAPSYSQVYTAFSYECRDVGGGEEDERER
jgi:hypothetical protein